MLARSRCFVSNLQHRSRGLQWPESLVSYSRWEAVGEGQTNFCSHGVPIHRERVVPSGLTHNPHSNPGS